MNASARNLFVLSVLALAAVPFVGCNGGETDDGSSSSSNDEFVESVPNTDMLALSTGDQATISQGLVTTEQGLGVPGHLRQHTEDLLRGTNDLIQETHAAIDKLTSSSDPVELELENATCKRWLGDNENASWRFTACQRDATAKRYVFTLQGRPLASTSNDDYKLVFAGEGFVLPRHEDRKRGRGVVGYDLDHLSALTGANVSGKVGIGYRAAGRLRQLNIGLKQVKGPNMDEARSAAYSFKHAIGKGGSFKYLTHHDLVTPSEDGGFDMGDDGTKEFGRAHVAWSTQGAARAAVAVCGGSVGQSECIFAHQCWMADGEVTMLEVIDRDSEPQWEATSCAEVFENINGAPPEAEVGEPAMEGEAGPLMAIPEAGADE